MSVSFENCKVELLDRAGFPAAKVYQEWRQRPGYEKVVEFVESFEHSELLKLTPADVSRAIKDTEHALGDIPKEHQIKEIEDFTCPFALQHLFHRYIERLRCVPTWQQYSSWMHKQAHPYWLAEIEPLKQRLQQQYSESRVEDAIRWRLGKFYYSALREVDLFVWLRAQSLDVRYHLLADVLLRVDFWMEDVLICIYFANERYRTRQGGRKRQAITVFGQAKPPFKILEFEVQRQGYGKIWPVTEESKRALVEEIRSLVSDG